MRRVKTGSICSSGNDVIDFWQGCAGIMKGRIGRTGRIIMKIIITLIDQPRGHTRGSSSGSNDVSLCSPEAKLELDTWVDSLIQSRLSQHRDCQGVAMAQPDGKIKMSSITTALRDEE